MSEAKHTPGEWKSFGIYVYQIDGDGYKRRIADCSSKPANIITVDEIMEDSANAHLIAAAPDLLEALEAAQRFIQNGIKYGYINMPDNNCGDSALETPAKIERAIQKAKGEKQ